MFFNIEIVIPPHNGNTMINLFWLRRNGCQEHEVLIFDPKMALHVRLKLQMNMIYI